jgi:glucosylglycerate synthase
MASTGLSSSGPSDAAPSASCAIVVGIGSYNDAATIGPLARAVSDGLQRSGRAGCVVLADGGSSDQTLPRAQEAAAGAAAIVAVAFPRPVVDPLRAPYHGLEGRPAAIRTVLREASARSAEACIFLDARLTSVTADWILRLLEPVLTHGHDYVAPHYVRHTFEGAITRSVIYPLFRALYGVRVRQPATGEFACSARFVRHVLDEPFWDGDEAQSGIDLWLAAAAVTGGMRVCEAALGMRTHRTVADAPDLNTTVGQVVGALFSDIEVRVDAWQRIRGSAAVPCFGAPLAPPPPPPPVDAAQMVEAFRLAYGALRDVWAWVLQPRTILRLKRLAETPSDQLRVGDELWAEIVFDFALAHHARAMHRDHLLGSFTPLYLLWLAGFISELTFGPALDPEERLERLCLAFEMKKPYLIAGWRWPERFRA